MRSFISILFFAFLFTFSSALLAQPPDPGGGTGENPNCFPPPCVPIDGGISWLLLAGAVYGGKKVFDNSKKEEEEVGS